MNSRLKRFFQNEEKYVQIEDWLFKKKMKSTGKGKYVDKYKNILKNLFKSK